MLKKFNARFRALCWKAYIYCLIIQWARGHNLRVRGIQVVVLDDEEEKEKYEKS